MRPNPRKVFAALFPLCLALASQPAAAQLPEAEVMADVMRSARDSITTHMQFGEVNEAVEAVWMTGKVSMVVPLADQMIETDPTKFAGHALKYFAYVELGSDRIGGS